MLCNGGFFNDTSTTEIYTLSLHDALPISDLTGYPEEMLNLDMDIEADLGIDSIKRVEILSVLEDRLPELLAETGLERPGGERLVFAPHYYDPSVIMQEGEIA